jgi:hypothetical protein
LYVAQDRVLAVMCEEQVLPTTDVQLTRATLPFLNRVRSLVSGIVNGDPSALVRARSRHRPKADAADHTDRTDGVGSARGGEPGGGGRARDAADAAA